MSDAQAPRPVVLVTGSEGLIGDAIVQSFSGDFQVSSFDIARPQKDPEVQDFIPCDLTQDASVDHALATMRERRGEHLASVIHLAAYYDFSGEPSHLYRDLTIEGTRRLLRGLRRFRVEQFVFASTILIMKPAEDATVLTEESSANPAWAYPESKLETEHVIEQERGDMRAVILRVGGVYNELCRAVPIAHQISRIYEKDIESYVFPGDAGRGQAFVHLDDLIHCIRRVVDRRRELDDFELFLVGEPDVMSYKELQNQIAELIHGSEWPTIRVPKPVAKAGAWLKDHLVDEEDKGAEFIKPWMIDLADQNYPVSIEKARRLLGWQPRQRLRETLPKMVGNLLTNPERWYEENGIPVPEGIKT